MQKFGRIWCMRTVEISAASYAATPWNTDIISNNDDTRRKEADMTAVILDEALQSRVRRAQQPQRSVDITPGLMVMMSGTSGALLGTGNKIVAIGYGLAAVGWGISYALGLKAKRQTARAQRPIA